jgi:hypothetical protein
VEPLRFDPQRAGVAVDERALDLLELRRRRGRQHPDVLHQGNTIEGVVGHQLIIRPGPATDMGRASYLSAQ